MLTEEIIAKKEKKIWDRNDRSDPNYYGNITRASLGRPAIDIWNVGVEYTWDGAFAFL